MRTRNERSHGVMDRNHPASSLRRCLRVAILLVALRFIPAGVTAADLYWIGDGGNWSDTGNWATESGGTGGAGVPKASDIAVFDDGGGDCMIDATVEVYGIDLRSDYAGTLIQNEGVDINIVAGGYTQAAGTFSGGNANMTISSTGTELYTLTGGTFNAPNGVLSIERTGGDAAIFTYADGVFSAPGTLTFNSWNTVGSQSYNHNINLNGQFLTVSNLVYTGGNANGSGRTIAYNLSSGGGFIVEGNFLFEADRERSAAADVRADGGLIRVYGGITVNNGTRGGTTVVEMIGSDDSVYACAGTDARLPRLKINKSEASATVTPSGETLNLGVANFTLAAGVFTAPSNTMSIGNDIQTSTDFDHTGGVFNPPGTLQFDSWVTAGSKTYAHTINLLDDSLTVSNLVYTGGKSGAGSFYYTLSGDKKIIVKGDFIFEGTASLGANGGTIEVHGDVTIQNSATLGGTTQIILAGSNDQTLVHGADATLPGAVWTIDKPTGTVTVATDFTLDGTKDLDWLGGTLNLHTNTFSVGGNVTIGPDATMLGVTVAGTETAGKLMAGGTANAIGNVKLAILVTADGGETVAQTYTILENNAVLHETFESVTWLPARWRGAVRYDHDASKTVTLSGIHLIPLGTLIKVR